MPGWTTSWPPTGRRRRTRTSPAHRYRAGTVALALLLLAAACGGGEREPAAAPAADPSPAPANVVGRNLDVEVFFPNVLLGDLCTEVFPVTRTVDAEHPVPGALEELLTGPTADERGAGYGGWFTPATAEVLLHVEVIDGTARVVLRDLRTIIPSASTSCGSSMLLGMLDSTLLALEGVDATRYALADQAAFYAWLQLADPDAPDPDLDAEPTEPAQPDKPSGEPKPDEPSDEDGAPVDLEAGWTMIDDFRWPVEPGCCSIETTGPVSPAEPLPHEGWPTDGFYAVAVERSADTPATLQLTVQRWVACVDHPELGCGDIPDGAASDERIAPDPHDVLVLEVPLEDIGSVLVPIHDWPADRQTAIEGAPGALATLLTSGVDPAFRTWITEPYLEGATEGAVWADVVELAADPAFPFGVPDCGDSGMEYCGPISYRGPFGTFLIANPGAISYADLGAWPPGYNGLYAWQEVTLEVRDGGPILYLWAGQLAG